MGKLLDNLSNYYEMGFHEMIKIKIYYKCKQI